MTGLYVNRHIEPAIYHPNMELSHLDGATLLFAVGELIDKAECAYLKSFLANGGRLVLEEDAAFMSLESPDDTGIRHALLESLGVDVSKKGASVEGLAIDHDLYKVGRGELLLLRPRMQDAGRWTLCMPSILKWSGVESTRLFDSDDPFMQMHLLRSQEADYLAVTHRGHDQNAYDGPREWKGLIRLFATPGKGPFEVDEIWADGTPHKIGVMDKASLAKGFDAGSFSEMQMKIFKVSQVK